MPHSRVKLSALDYLLLDYLEEHESFQHAPTIQEVSDSLGKSKFDIKSRLAQLEKLKLIKLNLETSVITLVSNAEKNFNLVTQLPYMGALGKDVRFELERGITSYVEIPNDLLHETRKEKLIALKAKDDSMLDVMICKGDLLVVEEVSKIHDGALSMLWLEDKKIPTIKYYFREENRVRLQSLNPSIQKASYYEEKDIKVMGKLVLLVRLFN